MLTVTATRLIEAPIEQVAAALDPTAWGTWLDVVPLGHAELVVERRTGNTTYYTLLPHAPVGGPGTDGVLGTLRVSAATWDGGAPIGIDERPVEAGDGDFRGWSDASGTLVELTLSLEGRRSRRRARMLAGALAQALNALDPRSGRAAPRRTPRPIGTPAHA
jgi:hypothetical protein